MSSDFDKLCTLTMYIAYSGLETEIQRLGKVYFHLPL